MSRHNCKVSRHNCKVSRQRYVLPEIGILVWILLILNVWPQNPMWALLNLGSILDPSIKVTGYWRWIKLICRFSQDRYQFMIPWFTTQQSFDFWQVTLSNHTVSYMLLWKLGKFILESSLFCCESQDKVLTQWTLPTDLYNSSSISPGGHKL